MCVGIYNKNLSNSLRVVVDRRLDARIRSNLEIEIKRTRIAKNENYVHGRYVLGSM